MLINAGATVDASDARGIVFVERNPYLPLVMECPKTGTTFRLGVNSGTWENSNGGRTKCPICGDWHEFTKENTRAVSFKEAEELPHV